MLITQISLANTFSDWLIATQGLITNSNTLETGDYYKTENTLYITAAGSDIDGTPTALYVNNHAYFGSISIGGGTFGGGNLSANTVYANNLVVYETATANNIYANNAYIQYEIRTKDLYANSVFANNVTSGNGVFNNLRANTANVKDLFVSNSLSFGPEVVLPDILSVGNTITLCTRTPQTNGQIVISRGENLNPSNANATLRWAESDKKWKVRDVDDPTTYHNILLDDDSYIRKEKLGSGVPTSITYLAGDGVWRVVATGNTEAQAVANTFYPIRETFTATNNQTVFTSTNGYIPYYIDVFYNGAKLVNGTDVDVSNGSIITLTTGAATDAVVEIVGFKLSSSNTGLNLYKDDSSSALNVPLTDANTGIIVNAFVANSKPLTYNPGTGELRSLSVTQYSDIALKENIASINNSIDIINQLNPVEFNWKSSGIKSYGVIAQELEEILPELVTNSNGIRAVNHIPLIAFLLKAVKDLDARLTALENK